MMMSESINEIAVALCKVQSSLKPAKKGKENTFFKSHYSDLACIWESCRELLASNGLSVAQVPIMEGGAFMLATVLIHNSGQYIGGTYPIKANKDDPQSWGSAYSYARRYSLASILGVYSESEDDDGEGAMARGAHTEAKADMSDKHTTSKDKPATDKPAKETNAYTFIPNGIVKKAGEKNGKVWLKWDTKTDRGWFTTFDEKVAEILEKADANGDSVTVQYFEKGDFKTITNAIINESVPF